MRRSSAPAFLGQAELLCPAPTGKSDDQKCDNFEELALVTNNGNIETLSVVSYLLCQTISSISHYVCDL